jgi:hypothetical protein
MKEKKKMVGTFTEDAIKWRPQDAFMLSTDRKT